MFDLIRGSYCLEQRHKCIFSNYNGVTRKEFDWDVHAAIRWISVPADRGSTEQKCFKKASCKTTL